MSRAIYALFPGRNEALDGPAAVECLELIVGLSTPTPKHSPLAAALKHLIELSETSAVEVAALADWWSIVASGQKASGNAWTLPAGLDPMVQEFLELTRDRSGDGDDTPLLQRIIQRRLFNEALGDIEHALEYSDTDTTKFQGEENAWDDLVQDLRDAVKGLRSGSFGRDLPEIDEGDAKKAMKKYSVVPGSPRWKYFLRRLETVRRCRDRLVEIREDVREVPKEIEVSPESWFVPEGDAVVSRGLAAVLSPLFGRTDEEKSATVARLTAVAQAGDAGELDWLACVSEPWAEWGDVAVPELSPRFRRYREAAAQILWLQSQGIDVDLAVLNLEEGNLADAETALGDQEARRRSLERRKSLGLQIDSLRRTMAGEDEGPLEELRTELDLIEQGLTDSTVDEAYERFHEVSRKVDEVRREAHIAQLEEIRDAFTLLGNRPNAAELTALVDMLRANPSVPVPFHHVQEARGRLEQIRDELEERTARLRDETRRRVENAGQDLEASARTNIEALLDSSDRISRAGDPLGAEAEAQRARDALDRLLVPEWTAADGEATLVAHLTAYIRALTTFSERDIRRIHVALKTRRFIILTGLTGSGKSTIARLFAEAFHATAENKRFVRVAVRPNWVDESEVLGYVNPLSNKFEPGWLATLMRACERDPNLPFFCLLDEMNLAPVEQYLADVLSAMEEAFASRAPVMVQLYSPGAEPTNASEWPCSIPFPGNLFLFGTVNVDESTRALSDRVLDRANVIQLSVEIGREHHSPRPMEQQVGRRRVKMRDWLGICALQGTDRCHDLLVDVAECFTQMRIGLGVRSHFEIERFLANAVDVLDPDDALDLALLQKAIPKVRGFKRELAPGLTKLRELAERGGADRTVSVLDDWLDGSVSDDSYVDGTDARVGIVTSY